MKIIDEIVEDVPFEMDAALVILTGMITHIDRAIDIAGKFRAKGAKVIIGGPGAYSCMDYVQKSNAFDSIDPFITRNAQIKCVSVEELADMGNIFLTHGHFDHAMDVPAIVSSGNSKVYCSRDTKNLLIKENVPNSRITAIQPGDIIENDPFRIRVFAGEHVKPDRALLLRTFINPQILLNFRTFCSFMRVHKKFDMGQMLAYQIEAGGKTIFHFGSLNLSMNEEYPQGVDLMTIPFQGRSI